MSADYTTMLQALVQFFNTPNSYATDAIFASNFVAHLPLMPPLSQPGLRGFLQGLYMAFPDLRMHINDSMMISDKLVLRTTFCGNHYGSFLGIPPTGSPVVISSISIFRAEHDLLVENWTEMDILGVIRQISHNPPPDLLISSN